MVLNKKGGIFFKLLILIIIIIALFIAYEYFYKSQVDKKIEWVQNYEPPKPNFTTEHTIVSPSPNNIKFASWNLQIFGQSKADNPELMKYYTDTIKNYDIVFVQEIRDASDTSFKELCNMLPDYNCVESSRAGRSSSKEQYGLLYKKQFSIVSIHDFNPDTADRWERPPFNVVINIGTQNISFYNIHTKPEDVSNEMTALESVVTGNAIILGDLNADCTYYNNVKETQFDSWNWLITDNMDTTSTASDCAYDRIIVRGTSIKNSGIMSNVNTAQSDHFLVWGEI